jgi:5-formyltetrahydrofolate cyclo-ligase
MVALNTMPLNANQSRPGKAALRKAILSRRAGLNEKEVRLASLAATVLVERLERWRSAKEVMVYLAFKGEIETTELLQDLWNRRVRVLAPRCRPWEDGILDVACISCLSDLAPGAYGILEPKEDRCPTLGRFSPGVALIPAVAFDRRGARLGFGQGYYDRLLAGSQFDNTFLIGLAHSFQVVEHLPRDSWDKPVHVVVTEEEIIWP